MPDQDSSKAPPTDSDEKSTPQVPVGIPTSDDKEIATDAECCPSNKEDKATKLEKDIRKGEIILCWITGIGVAVNLVIALIYYGQLSQMRIATEASTKTAQLAADSLEYNAGQFDRNMRQIIYQTVAQAEAAAASQKAANAAKSTADTAVNQLELAERPWIKYESHFEPVAGKPEQSSFSLGIDKIPNIPIRFINVGKGPASDCRVAAFVELVNADRAPSLDRVDSKFGYPHSFMMCGTIFPTDHADMQVQRTKWKDIKEKTVIGDPLRAEEGSLLSSGKIYVAIYGIASYKDSIGIDHWTRFCDWVPSGGLAYNAGPCVTYNKSDDNRPKQ